MNHPVMSHPCPKPDACLFTGCQGNCAASVPAAAGAVARATLPLFAPRRSTESPFKPRDPRAQRRLLVAS